MVVKKKHQLKKTRILVTTAIGGCLEVSQPILFLDRFCMQSGQELWQKLDYELVPENILDLDQKIANYEYVNTLSDDLIIELTDALNRKHGTSYTVRYWKILLGTWVYRFVSILFNRWTSIQEVVNNCQISKTIILDIPKEKFVPKDYHDFARIYRMGYEWDHAIYGMILKDWTNVVCETKVYDKEKINQPLFSSPNPGAYRRFLKNIISKVGSLMGIFSRQTDGVLIETYMSSKEAIKLQLALGQSPVYRRTPPTPNASLNFNYRKNLLSNTNKGSDFEIFVRKLVSEQIPTCYLEGYAKLSKCAQELNWPRKPKFIFTSNAFDGNEVFKIWAAEKTEANFPYIIGQHGGHYGIGKFAFSERHEVDTCDRYLTWGWSDQGSKHYPVCILKKPKKNVNDFNGKLLLVERGSGNKDMPWDETRIYERYCDDQLLFASLLPLNIQKDIIVRLYSSYLFVSHSEATMWHKRHPNIVVDNGINSIAKLTENSRIIVHTFNGSGILENMSQNMPVLIFWKKDYLDVFTTIRPSAKPYFDELESVGIFHTSADSIAKKVIEIWDNVENWWHQPSIQKVRLNFCSHYANNVKDRTEVLKEALISIK